MLKKNQCQLLCFPIKTKTKTKPKKKKKVNDFFFKYLFAPKQGSRTSLPCDCGYCVFWSTASHDINAVYSVENIILSSIMKLPCDTV